PAGAGPGRDRAARPRRGAHGRSGPERPGRRGPAGLLVLRPRGRGAARPRRTSPQPAAHHAVPRPGRLRRAARHHHHAGTAEPGDPVVSLTFITIDLYRRPMDRLSRRAFVGSVGAGTAGAVASAYLGMADAATAPSLLDDRVGWGTFLAAQDPVWKQLPTQW